MHFRHELSYDAPPEAVHAMLSDADFRESVTTANDVVSAVVALAAEGDGFRLSVDQVTRNRGLPSFARKVAGETTRVVHREAWQDASGGSIVIETPGMPVTMEGTIRLEPDGAGTREVVELDVTVKVPLIGGRLESLLDEKIRSGMDVQHGVAVAWLKGTL